MYKIKRTRKFYDTLQLCDEQGTVQKELKIEVDIDTIETGFREVLKKLEKAQKSLQDNQKLKKQNEFDKAYYDYGEALIKMFEMCFGTENTQEIVMASLFYSCRAAVGRCPTPCFLFGPQKGSEKRNDGFAAFLFFRVLF